MDTEIGPKSDPGSKTGETMSMGSRCKLKHTDLITDSNMPNSDLETNSCGTGRNNRVISADADKSKTPRWKHLFVVVAANTGAFATGAVINWSPIGWPTSTNSWDSGNISHTEASRMIYFALLGATFSCIFSGALIRRFGKRAITLALTAPFLGGWIMIYFGKALYIIYVGRILTGFGAASFAVSVPVFFVEKRNDKNFGPAICATDLGMLYICTVQTFVPHHVQVIFCGFIVAGQVVAFFVPECPQHLVDVGDEEMANKALSWLHGMDTQESKETLAQLVLAKQSSAAHTVQLANLKIDVSFMKPLLICFGMTVFDIMFGYDAMALLAVSTCNFGGLEIHSHVVSLILGSINVIGVLPAYLIVQKFGRRVQFVLSELLMLASILFIGTYFYMLRLDVSTHAFNAANLHWLPLTGFAAFFSSFAIGIGPVAANMIEEYLPRHYYGLALSIATNFRWALGIAVANLLPVLEDKFGKSSFYFLISSVSLCSISVIFYINTYGPRVTNRIRQLVLFECPESGPSKENCL